MSLDGFSMHPLVAELNEHLSGSRIDKISQPNKQTICFSLRQPGQTYILHISINPQNPAINLIPQALENPAEPPVFCMVLRKQLEGGRLAQIQQHGLDRLILLDIDMIGAGGMLLTKTLVIELMGKYSNIILLQENTIIDSLRKVGRSNSRIRLVLPGYPYELPPNQDKLNILTTSPEKVLETLRQSPELALSKAIINTCLGFGPVTAREIAFSAGLPASLLIADLEPPDYESLSAALGEIAAAGSGEKLEPCLVIDENKKLLAMAAFHLHTYSTGIVQTFSSMSSLVDASTKFSGQYVLPDKDRLKKLVHNELVKSKNKEVVLDTERLQAEQAEDFKIIADNLMTYQYQLVDHADEEVCLPNIYATDESTLKIPLDKRQTIIQNMQSYYHKYDKLKRAQNLLAEQLLQCQNNIQYLLSIEASLESSATLAEINEIKTELIATGYLHERLKKKPGAKPAMPFKFQAPSGKIVLVGKNNYQNDALTFKTAHHNDLWFHTKDIAGSHVILRCENTPPEEADILFAANLAAHFSKAQNSSNIPVDYTLCRYVKKPSGAKPGFVIFTNQKTLYVTPDQTTMPAILLQDLNK